jgi:NAD(P)-dependent dehydrogenase (short-subunit alcohol dehydrogenase family)
MADGAVVVVGGNSGLGKEVARHYAATGAPVVITGRDAAKTDAAVAEVGGATSGLTFDLAQPHGIAAALAPVGPVRALVLAAIERDDNDVKGYDIDRAIRLATIKLVGYTEVVHALLDRMGPESSIVVFGGLAKERPYPGSTTVSTVNGGVVGMVRTMCHELAPIRVNSLHPGIVEDSPYWAGKTPALDRVRARTLTGRMVQMADIVDATRFLIENPSINGIELFVDGGWIIN